MAASLYETFVGQDAGPGSVNAFEGYDPGPVLFALQVGRVGNEWELIMVNSDEQ